MSSETPVTPSPEAAAVAPPATGGGPGPCPITDEFLPPNMRKHVDPNGPAPLRMMAAKTLVPLNPGDMVSVLFMLRFDPDGKVRETAEQSIRALPDRILASALRDEEVHPPVLGYLLEVFREKDVYAEMLILNASTPDEAVAILAPACSTRLLEIISQNQLRLLRHETIVRGICQNPNGVGALVDGVCDFAVRSGLVLADVPQMQQARVRVFGPEALEKPPDPGPSAAEVLQEYGAALVDETAQPMEEGRRLNLTQRIMKMNVSEKIKLASMGNKEARGLLLRDSNRLVAIAVIRSPRITENEVLMCANNRAVNDDVLRVICHNREWTKLYPIRLALVKNPKTPLGISMRFMSGLREAEVKDLTRDKNVASGIRLQAKKLMDKKNAPKREEK